jgi:hypothetical protein
VPIDGQRRVPLVCGQEPLESFPDRRHLALDE